MFTVRTLKKGFTLIELMVVIAVIAILATIALFGLGKAQASARDVSRQQVMNGVRAALEKYYGDKGYYPVAGANWGAFIATLTTAPGYLAAAPTDPCGGGTAIPAAGVTTLCGSSQATYLYAPAPASCAATACTSYVLTLTKEGGGTSTFTSPQ